MKKILLLTLTSILSIVFLYAEDKIQLPDVTTVVSGDSLTAGKNSIPDFSEIVPEKKDDSVLPKLPDAQNATVNEEPEADVSYDSDKAVYAEGLIGGGYPSFFKGDFSIYKSSGSNPFNLRFLHESENAYGAKSSSDGYFDNTTELSGEKIISFKNVTSNLNASYSTKTDGLQSLSDCFFDQTKQNVAAAGNVEWSLPYNLKIAVSLAGNYYSRYEGLITKNTVEYSLQEKGANVASLNPKFIFSWNNKKANENGFYLEFNSSYNFESFLSETEFDDSSLYSKSKYLNRGNFGLNGNWNNDFIMVSGNISLVIGDSLGKPSVIAPFDINIQGNWNKSSAPQPGMISVKGGLDSTTKKYSELESNCKFSSLTFLPSETSDWFASLKTFIPIASSFAINANADWKMTAFENGIWEPDYSVKQNCGLYNFVQNDRNYFSTDLGLSFLYKIITISASWKANWLYVPVDETPYSVSVSASAQKANGAWGTSISLVESIGENVDYVPIVNAVGFYRLGDSIKLVIELNDAVKLFTGTDRKYCSSEYLTRTGSVNMLVKFLF